MSSKRQVKKNCIIYGPGVGVGIGVGVGVAISSICSLVLESLVLLRSSD